MVAAPLILSASQDAATSLPLAGGKGANLSCLIGWGFPVPAACIVTTDAYRSFVAENRLGQQICSALQPVPSDPPAFEAASASIRRAFQGGRVPHEVQDAVLDAYRGMGPGPVAVRSSATAEDLPGLSFAGQQDTVLNVVGNEAVLKALVECWASLWTARAIAYRARQGVPAEGLALAVVVQQMVDSQASGVLFTANPLTGKRHECVVNATFGLGDALVSGQVEPDQYVVDTRTSSILHKTLGAKALVSRTDSQGKVESAAGPGRWVQSIADQTVLELAELGARVEARFGFPQDVEWAYADGKLHLLQARPITALYPPPDGFPEEPLHVFFSFAAVQGLLEPITPLGRDSVRAVFAGGARLFGGNVSLQTQTAIYEAGERLWVNLSPPLRTRVGRRVLPRALANIDPGASEVIGRLLEEGALGPPAHPGPRSMLRVARVAAPALFRFLRGLARPTAGREAARRAMEAMVARVEQRATTARTLPERLELFEWALGQLFPTFIQHAVPRMAAGLASLGVLRRLASPLPGGQHTALTVARGLPHNVTTQMDLELWAVAAAIKSDAESLAWFTDRAADAIAEAYADGRLPGTAQQTLDAFMREYGMRGIGEVDLGRPRWREQPRAIVSNLQNYVRLDDPNQAPDRVFRAAEAAAEQAIEALAKGVRHGPLGRLKAALVRAAARRVRELVGLREVPKFMAMRVFGLLREGLLDSGRELAASGVLVQAEDVFYLRLAELKRLAAAEPGDWQRLVAERRQRYRRELRRRRVPRVLASDGRAFFERPAAASGGAEQRGGLHGTPVSPGVVEGRVRVVLDPAAAALEAGEIMVCPATDPAWTPLFLTAGGLVTEIGGLMTHGSVVAREYGLPAVVGVANATERLATGQRVRVDGSSGRVTILDESD